VVTDIHGHNNWVISMIAECVCFVNTCNNPWSGRQAGQLMKIMKTVIWIARAAALIVPAIATAQDLHQVSELHLGGGMNHAETHQYGHGNEGSTYQQGHHSESLIIQRGTANRALSLQVGGGHDARVLQSGGYLDASIVQFGYGHEASIQQRGVGKEASVIQGGVYGNVDVMQLGNSRRTPVEIVQFSRGQAAIQVIQH
jgi:minor curlin subunit